jgi:LIVCS family branched-chain amino acid:cation transporter
MLNIMPNKLAGKNVFRAVVFVSLLFSIPDAVNQLFPEGAMSMLTDKIPLAQYHVGWLLPALVTFVAVNYYNLKRRV